MDKITSVTYVEGKGEAKFEIVIRTPGRGQWKKEETFFLSPREAGKLATELLASGGLALKASARKAS